MKLTLCMWYQSSPVESSTDRSIINSETALPAQIPHNGNSAPRSILSSYRIQLMFMNACNIYITYFHHHHSMSSIIYTHFIIIIINTKHVHIYITSFNTINHHHHHYRTYMYYTIIIIKSENIHVFTSSKTIQSSLYNPQQSLHNHVFKTRLILSHLITYVNNISSSNEQSIQIILILSHEISHEFHYKIKQDHHTNHV